MQPHHVTLPRPENATAADLRRALAWFEAAIPALAEKDAAFEDATYELAGSFRHKTRLYFDIVDIFCDYRICLDPERLDDLRRERALDAMAEHVGPERAVAMAGGVEVRP